jgi:hypothetical protein
MEFAYRLILHPGDTATLGAPGYFQAYRQPGDWELRVD